MNDYGILIEPGTIRFERLLPGPPERIWAWLTESDKEREMAGIPTLASFLTGLTGENRRVFERCTARRKKSMNEDSGNRSSQPGLHTLLDLKIFPLISLLHCLNLRPGLN